MAATVSWIPRCNLKCLVLSQLIVYNPNIFNLLSYKMKETRRDYSLKPELFGIFTYEKSLKIINRSSNNCRSIFCWATNWFINFNAALIYINNTADIFCQYSINSNVTLVFSWQLQLILTSSILCHILCLLCLIWSQTFHGHEFCNLTKVWQR